MPEPDPGTEFDQSRLHRGGRRLDGYVQQFRRPPDQQPVTRRVGRRQLQQSLGLDRQG